MNANSISDDSSTAFALALAKDKDTTEINIEECIKQMKQGSTMLKYTRTTKPHFRKFVLSQDETKLIWGSPAKSKAEAQVSLGEVKSIIVGQKTVIFQRYLDPDLGKQKNMRI